MKWRPTKTELTFVVLAYMFLPIGMYFFMWALCNWFPGLQAGSAIAGLFISPIAVIMAVNAAIYWERYKER